MISDNGFEFPQPSIVVYRDGSSLCAVWSDFRNLQEHHAGFGETGPEAIADLLDKSEGNPL